MPALPTDIVLAAAAVVSTCVAAVAGFRSGSRRAEHAAVERTHVARMYSRAGFDTALTAELRRRTRIGGQLAVVVLDVDRLAQVNDRSGYRSGDVVIAHVEAAIESTIRRIDLPARLGGATWALLLPDATPGDLQQLTVALQAAVGTIVSDADSGRSVVQPSISLGAAMSPSDGMTATDLLHAADQALVVAKARGGRQLAIHGLQTRQLIGTMDGRRRVEQDAQLATVVSLAQALDLRDADTAMHSSNVGRFAELMAIELGMQPGHVERIRIAGLLHDIGKIGVPDSVLRKPGKLDDDEWTLIREHPEIGARVLAALDVDDIRSWVLSHHERPDGRGYPQGLEGDSIPIESRILAVADSYEAMTADRVYRAAPGPEFARSELAKWSGSQFDPEVVAAFVRLLDRLEGVVEDAPAGDASSETASTLATWQAADAA